MNVTQPLPNEVTIQDSNGKLYNQVIEYNWMPVYYEESLIVGHRCQSKEKRLAPKKPPGGKVWLRKGGQDVQPEVHVNIQSQEEFPALNKGKEAHEWKEPKVKSTVKGRVIKHNAASIDFTNGFSMLDDPGQESWVLMGDFNTILEAEERIMGNVVQKGEVRDFHNFVQDNNLAEMKYVGRRYTWSNSHIHSKHDRAIVNVE
ncbi:hypothetical protein HAX54_029164 [Datura stramonium]|uniref:Uncharacterized protein n=1 Tax=Datura stramonium TaxID=4076 RepID=A0ABS8SA42_DATST|nr:hypothetical protein [Datura stramonium]